MIGQLASDWLKTKEFQEVVNDVMRMLRNFMGNKTFLITHMRRNRFTIIQSVKGSVEIHEGFAYSNHEAVYHQWDGEIKEALVINNTEEHPFLQGNPICQEFGIRSYLGVPLLLKDGSFFGTLCAIDNEPYEFTPIDIDTMTTLANLMTKAIELHKMSVIDHLTGLHNKSYLDNKLEQMMNQPHLTEIISVVLFDVDNFKMINDTYGHCVGDDVLEYIGKCVREIMPEESIPFRFGGDEFCIFLPEYRAEQVISYVVELQERVSNYQASSISLSVGISDTTLSDRDSLLDTADIALYKAKKKGKKQYSIYID